MDNYFQNIFSKISGSQEDNHILIFGCPHSIFGRRGHEDTQILLPCKLLTAKGPVINNREAGRLQNRRASFTQSNCTQATKVGGTSFSHAEGGWAKKDFEAAL